MVERVNIPKTNTYGGNGLNGNNAFFFQPKLTINAPNDIYEQEADAVADKVMRMPDKSFVNTPTFFKPALIPVQRKCAACEEEELDRKSTRLNSSHGYISYAV